MMQSATGGGRDERDEPDFREIKDRLDKLESKLDRARERETPPDTGAEERGRAMGIAFRMATELVAGVFVGGLIGWALDNWLGTKPFLLILFLLLGIAAGLLNTVRAAQEMQKRR
jgi:ATP synthase protein I